ncbi:MAG TPA: hypothetical protein VK775_17090 [Chthoniobacterales bacterium]|nr:hypothetical protein [Chthoniobacterales bacterium]
MRVSNVVIAIVPISPGSHLDFIQWHFWIEGNHFGDGGEDEDCPKRLDLV